MFSRYCHKRSVRRLWLTPLEKRCVPAIFTVTTMADSGTGSLRAALTSAQNNGQDDTITFDTALVTGPIMVTSGQLIYAAPTAEGKSLTIDWPGAGKLGIQSTGAASSTRRVFSFSDSSTATSSVVINISNLAISGGNVSGGTTASGAGILVSNEKLTVTNCDISGNTASLSGGAIATSAGGGAITLSGCFISANRAIVAGAITTGSSTLTINKGTTITGNTSTAQGGAIATSKAVVSIDHATISNNSAAGNGGALQLSGTTITLNEANISGNSANGRGGAMYLTGTTVTLNKANISGNKSPTYGGGIHAETAIILTATDSTFSANVGATGGAISTYYKTVSTVTLNGCNVSGNTATANVGGAIYMGNYGSLSINQSVISANTAQTSGGGIAAYATNTTIVSCAVSGNIAKGNHGGGVYFYKGTSMLTGTTVNGNSATSYGGGIATSGKTTISQCTISDNLGGGITAGGDTLSIFNSTIAGNKVTAVNGVSGGISHYGTTSIFTLQSSIVAGNSSLTGGPDININGSSGAVITGSNNLIGVADVGGFKLSGTNFVGTKAAPLDPRLEPLANNGGPTMTRAFRPGSKAANNGNNTQSFAFDQRGGGFPRLVGGALDIGAIEVVLVEPFLVNAAGITNVTTGGGTKFGFTVKYDDDVGIDISKLGNGEIVVAGPSGFLSAAAFTGFVTASGNAIDASYELTPPGGTWDTLDFGDYTINLVANKVFDLDPTPHSALAETAGKFNVSIAGNLIVDNATDVDDGNFTLGNLSLREAIRVSNISSGAADVITFDSSLSGKTINLVGGELKVTDGVVINGPGAAKLTIQGAATASATNRIFNINVAGKVGIIELTGVTLTGGNVVGSGGAILTTDDALYFNDVVFAGNKASGNGGAISLTNYATFRRVTFSGNVSAGSGGAISAGGLTSISGGTFTGNTAASGGAISTSGNLSISGSSFTGNVATFGSGGAIIATVSYATVNATNTSLIGNSAKVSGGAVEFSNGGTLTTNYCGLSDNAASGNGGAVSFSSFGFWTASATQVSENAATAGGGLYVETTGSFTFANSTVSGNKALTTGGGLRFGTSATVTLTNTTVSGNIANYTGGGIQMAGNFGKLQVNNSTIAHNFAGGGGGVYFAGRKTSAKFDSTIVAANAGAVHPDIAGLMPPQIVDGTNNLFGVIDPSMVTLTDLVNNQFGTNSTPLNPRLSPLGKFGGSTQTHALLFNSPAIGQGSNPASLPFDQRGKTRVVGNIDIGAFELQPAAKVSSIVIGDGTVQRSMITQLKVTFDSSIVFTGTPAAAFTLLRQIDSKTLNLAVAMDPTNTIATITFTGGAVDNKSLADGRYTLTALAAQFGADGLDGDGNGTGGDNYILASALTPNPATNKLFRLFGDSDGDGAVATNDFIQFRLALGGNSPIFDFDGDGAVAASDFIQFRLRFGGSI